MTDSLNATEIAVGSLLARNNGGGAWGGGYSDGMYGTMSANAVRIDRNDAVAGERSTGTRTLIDVGNTAIRDQFNTVNRANEFARLTDLVRDGDLRGSDQRFQSELRTNDRLLALQAEMNENARTAAQCCCDLKLKMCEDKSELLAAIAAVEGRNIERALNASQARVTQLETINALSKCFCPPPCPEK